MLAKATIWKRQDYVFVREEYLSSLKNSKHYLRRENKVNKMRCFTFTFDEIVKQFCIFPQSVGQINP